MRKIRKTTCGQIDKKTDGMPTQAWGNLEVPGDTKRSKIEDKLTKEKLIEKRKRGQFSHALGAFGPGADILGPWPPRASRQSDLAARFRSPPWQNQSPRAAIN